MCGSCWAYSATEGIESAVFMATGKLPSPLSPQQIVSCDAVEAAGCSGGDLPSALDYVEKAGGIESAFAYPATSKDTGKNGTCEVEPSEFVTEVNSYSYAVPPCSKGACTAGNEDALAAALAQYGPLSICINAGDGHWDFYESGIWPPPAHPCKADAELIDHCVQLVGYDKTHSPPYWKIRNSWGRQWGEWGYIKLRMGVNACGISNEAILVNASSVRRY